MRPEVKNQITMLGNTVATEIASPRDSHRRWLRLGPLEGRINLLVVEVPVDVDPVEWPKRGDDYVIVAQETFDSLDAALTVVRERGIDTGTFDAIWKSDNPF